MTINKNVDLSVEFCGFTLPNPFMLASAPPTAFGSMIKRAFALGWGGAVTKTIKPDHMVIEDVSPRFAVLKSASGQCIGFENIELVTKRPLQIWLEEITEIKALYPHHMLIGSIMAEVKRNEWQELAKAVEAAGVDALELNFSCPHGMPEWGIGAAIGQNADITKMITGWVKEVTNVPVIVKLTPNVGDIAAIGRAAYEGGADALAGINTVQCLMGVDLDTLAPLPSVGGYSTFGGYSGLAIKPMGLRAVAQLYQSIPLPISGMGGISSWEHAAEYMLLGARTVQVCTHVMLNGQGVIREWTDGLRSYIASKGYDSIEEMIGISAERVRNHASLNRDEKLVARICQDTCISCGICVGICEDAGYEALRLKGAGVVVDEDKCDGCSLCSIVCPTRAIKLTKTSNV